MLRKLTSVAKSLSKKLKLKIKLATTELDLFTTDERYLSFQTKTRCVSGRFLRLFPLKKKVRFWFIVLHKVEGTLRYTKSVQLFSIKQKLIDLLGTNLLEIKCWPPETEMRKCRFPAGKGIYLGSWVNIIMFFEFKNVYPLLWDRLIPGFLKECLFNSHCSGGSGTVLCYAVVSYTKLIHLAVHW